MPQVKLIAHRGNCDGPNPERENSPDYLFEAIARGVDVEVDVWVVDGEIYFGHDGPQYLVDPEFLESIDYRAWFHCKNFEALKYFSSSWISYKFFWHQNDDFALTNDGFIWTYPGKPYYNNSIVVDLRPNYDYKYGEVYAVCVDYLGDR